MHPANQPRLLVSACLCGLPCRYDGGACPVDRFVRLAEAGLALPVCPEELGGLPTPRQPCEILQGRVISRSGEDHTEAFALGAGKTLALAGEYGIHTAILKERSPSCGSSLIYDGGFRGECVPGRGICAALLSAHGIRVFSEENAPADAQLFAIPVLQPAE